ncbi:MAG: ABC transporter ATP-binding protein [Erysipelotrichaceae bacterium]|nr:ABC transporter ATP-binding protein [Erysipelotrichaceae bacterium]
MEYPIFVEGLHFGYTRVPVLNGVDMRIKKGSFTTIVGPNGSGKSTFIKNITRIVRMDRGIIKLNDRDLSTYTQRELSRIVASVPQVSSTEFDFTAHEVVMMGRYPHLRRFQAESEEDYRIVEEAMLATGVWEMKDASINSLSGGEKQRVIIARALAQQPEILVLDEPIAHLDLHHQIELMRLTRRLTKERGITVLAILHDLNFAIEFSDYVFMMNKGRVYREGSPASVIQAHHIKEVYEVDVCLIENPVTGNPHVIAR